MPELPEVETMRRGISRIAGRRITGLHVPRSRLKPIRFEPAPAAFRRRAVGHTIEAVERLGKRVVLRLDGDLAVVFEPRMTGLVLLAEPPDTEHLRLGLRLNGCGAPWLWYWDRRGLGSVRLLSRAQLQADLGPHRLGPDALELSLPVLRARLGSSRQPIKVALLDQRRLAGIGNLYASEILHVAGIHPQRPCDRLNSRQWRAIHAALRQVLREAIRCEGSTLGDGTYRNALNRPGSYQNHHRVYQRQGQPCPRCGRGQVCRTVQAQRATFFCPRCQRPGRRRPKR